jgi:hypothetical protein
MDKAWHDTSSARWQVEKISQEEIIVKLNYPGLVLQKWRLAFEGNNKLGINIDIENNKQISFSDPSLVLEINNRYKCWETANEHGKFLVKQYIDCLGPVRLKDNKVSKIVLKSKSNSGMPDLLFKVISHPERRILGVFKHKKAAGENIYLKSSFISSKKESMLKPGKHNYFTGDIVLGRDINPGKDIVRESVLSLSRGRLRFVFDRGKGRLLLSGRELTSGLGVYTSVRFQGIWHDSYQVAWQIIKNNNNKIIVMGDWPYVPLSQIWQIELIGANSISWKVKMHVHKKLVLDMQQANIMLSPEYKSWLAVPGLNQGRFLEEYTQDYDILPFRYWSGNAPRGISVSGIKLPSILFKCSLKERHVKAIIENTDCLYKARLLQYHKTNIKNLLPGQYPYFEGTIRIMPEQNEASNK